MPIYTFVCKECGNEQDELVPVGTESFKCSECGCVSKKTMSLCSFVLKGTGWARDGYGSKKASTKKSPRGAV